MAARAATTSATAATLVAVGNVNVEECRPPPLENLESYRFSANLVELAADVYAKTHTKRGYARYTSGRENMGRDRYGTVR